MNMFQSLSTDQLHTCLQMAIQQLITSATDAGVTTNTLLQQQKEQQQQQQSDQELPNMPETVTSLSTEQMQQLLQHQSALSMLNQGNVSNIFFCIIGTILKTT